MYIGLERPQGLTKHDTVSHLFWGQQMQKKVDFMLEENESLPFKIMIIHDVPSISTCKNLTVIRRSYPTTSALRPYRQLNVELLVYKKEQFTIVYNARLKLHVFYEATEDVILEINDTKLEIDKAAEPSIKEQIMNELSLQKKFIDDKFTGLVVPWSTILEYLQ
jgi:hypothetical protein